MKRDLDLQRSLLIEVESCEDMDGLEFVPAALLEQSGWPEGYLDRGRKMTAIEEYNLQKLCEAGLLYGDWRGEFWTLNLSHMGHDYLDSIRDEGVWASTKQLVAESGGSVTLEVIKSIAIGFLKKKIQQHTDISL